MRVLERMLWFAGWTALSVFAFLYISQEFVRDRALSSYKAALQDTAAPAIEIIETPTTESPEFAFADYDTPAPDQSLWSSGRISAFAASLGQETSPVLGVFEIPRFELELPIYDGASDLHMDRGIARIEGTAQPGHTTGNLGIAGHRDGYFRVLKDIGFGDEIAVTTAHGTQTFVVQQLMIVDPSAVEVLSPTDQASITLVTCYPFYFVGDAPERFIVRAVLRKEATTLSRR